jgi:phosphohistidine phosphatase
MRRLLLLRHAKSAWPDPDLPDRDRPLANRGREAAPRMGAYLRAEALAPSLAIVSPARRTRETWALVAPHLPRVETAYDDRLYEATPEDVLDVVREAPTEAEVLLLVGHNPGLHGAALDFLGAERSRARSAMAQKFPTAALAVVDFPGDDWRVGWAGGRLERFVTPKTIGAVDEDD